LTYNPYGSLGSIVVTPSKPMVTPRRLGTIGARLTDTKHGKAVRRTRTRHAVTTNRPKVERVLPTLDDDTALAIVRGLTTADTSATLNLNIHDK
jgi:hypothetical protein